MEAAAVMRGEKKIEDILFKMPKDGRIWGSNYPRPTAEQKVAGTLKFGQDLGLGWHLLCYRETRDMEHRIQVWATGNETASWETLPQEFKDYLELVESQP